MSIFFGVVTTLSTELAKVELRSAVALSGDEIKFHDGGACSCTKEISYPNPELTWWCLMHGFPAMAMPPPCQQHMCLGQDERRCLKRARCILFSIRRERCPTQKLSEKPLCESVAKSQAGDGMHLSRTYDFTCIPLKSLLPKF